MFEGAKILVISEDSAIRHGIGELLASCLRGAASVTFSENIALIGREPAARLVLIDLAMGFDEVRKACRRLRSGTSADELAIIVLVEDLDDASLELLIDAGADDVINRSFRPIGFCTRVSSHLRRVSGSLDLLRRVRQEVARAQHREKTLERFEEFFVESHEGMVVVDKNGKTISVNAQAASVLNRPSADLRDLYFSVLLDPDDRGRFFSLLDDFVEQKTRRKEDFRLEDQRPDERRLSIAASSFFAKDGLILLNIRDVTQQRITEQLLEEAQKKLLLSEKAGAMAELAGAAAHELNQPLTSIMTSLAVLRRIAPNEAPIKKVVDTMERETDRMAAMLRRLTRITAYTTKSYVGQSRIIDLERACTDLPGEEGDGE